MHKKKVSNFRLLRICYQDHDSKVLDVDLDCIDETMILIWMIILNYKRAYTDYSSDLVRAIVYIYDEHIFGLTYIRSHAWNSLVHNSTYNSKFSIWKGCNIV